MSAPAGHVEALWVGSYEAELPDKTVLVPGETVYVIPEGEASESDNWRPVVAKAPVPSLKVDTKENSE